MMIMLVKVVHLVTKQLSTAISFVCSAPNLIDYQPLQCQVCYATLSGSMLIYHWSFELHVAAQMEVDSVTETIERRVIEWKFHQLDKNGDGHLNRREFRVLRRLVRKVVRPKRCTKNFPRHCDSDQDRKLSRQEWSVCLGLGINSKFQLMLLVIINLNVWAFHRSSN